MVDLSIISKFGPTVLLAVEHSTYHDCSRAELEAGAVLVWDGIDPEDLKGHKSYGKGKQVMFGKLDNIFCPYCTL